MVKHKIIYPSVTLKKKLDTKFSHHMFNHKAQNALRSM